jgi:subtilisin family serine protease
VAGGRHRRAGPPAVLGDRVAAGRLPDGRAAVQGRAALDHRAGGVRYRRGVGTTPSGSHGTAVAALIAASEDDQGIVGVAPEASIVAY